MKNMFLKCCYRKNPIFLNKKYLFLLLQKLIFKNIFCIFKAKQFYRKYKTISV